MGANGRGQRDGSDKPDPRRRHVWVTWSMDNRNGAVPGLIKAWRYDMRAGWQARVEMVLDPWSDKTVETWVNREYVHIVHSESPTARRTAAPTRRRTA